jgi:DNA repair protein RadD
MLRPYQQAAHDAVIDWVRQSIEPCLIEAATGAGKSHIIAAVAKTIHEMSGKKVLCLCPSGELVEQNFEKYTKTGEKASLFSASVGKMSLAHNVVFGTPLTVKNKLSRFRGEFGMIIIDEADGITPSITNIIDSIRSHNPNVRVVGLTGTPYRLGSGFIYRMDEKGELVPEYKTKDPYFAKLLFRITARQLIDAGFLTPPEIGVIGAGKYATEGLQPNSMGKFDSKAVDQAYHGHGRKTAAIIGDIVAQSRGKQGVLIFCATVKHAQEAFASLPPEFSASVTDKTSKQDSQEDMRSQEIIES